jgi:hypothetical protein
MNSRILYEQRCRCKERNKKISRTPQQKRGRKREKIALPDLEEMMSETFQIRYDKKLSFLAKFILNTFKDKYIYYAIDDISYLLKSNPVERESLLGLLYSPVLYLHNNLCINFFDIWIKEVSINETVKVTKVNKFLHSQYQNSEPFTEITIKFLYGTRVPVKKADSLW